MALTVTIEKAKLATIAYKHSAVIKKAVDACVQKEAAKIKKEAIARLGFLSLVYKMSEGRERVVYVRR